MKPFLHGFLALTLAASVAAPLLAEDTVVSVTFDSITQIQTKSGETLDPTLFKFGKATGGNEDSSRASGSAWHKDKEAACRWALLGSFMKFQKKAQAAHKRVVGIRTYAGDQESAKADACLCLTGKAVVRSVIKASYK